MRRPNTVAAALVAAGAVFLAVAAVALLARPARDGATALSATAPANDPAPYAPRDDPEIPRDVEDFLAADIGAVASPGDAAAAQRYEGPGCGGALGGARVAASNAYGPGSRDAAAAAAGEDYPLLEVAEPFRATTLRVAGWPGDAATAWAAAWSAGGAPLWSYGASADVAFAEVGWARVAVADASRACWLAAQIAVRYVRREVRSLSDRDREAFLQGVMAMQRLPADVGSRLYGSAYRSKDHFNRLHLYYGGRAACDHWHQGAGFVTSHVALTLEYERSLQAIYPWATVPYWDISLESTFYDAAAWRTSAVFRGDWFGAAAPANGLRALAAGRFAFAPTMANARRFSRVANGYGLLRAPWNADPTPFLTRSGHVYGYPNNMKPSGCAEFARAVRAADWASLARQLNSAAHGHVHETLGGSWHHDLGAPATPAVLLFAHSVQALSKDLWRAGVLTCAAGCDPGATPAAACGCACAANASASPHAVLRDAGVLASLAYYDGDGRPLGGALRDDDPLYGDALRALCDPGHIGDMFQASSTNDPTFWVLHGNIDRVWHLKRLVAAARGGYDEAWRADHACYGHNPDDLQPWRAGALSPAGGARRRSGAGAYHTNRELYNLFRPADADLGYVYDSFDWPHCGLVGLDMVKAALAGLRTGDGDGGA